MKVKAGPNKFRWIFIQGKTQRNHFTAQLRAEKHPHPGFDVTPLQFLQRFLNRGVAVSHFVLCGGQNGHSTNTTRISSTLSHWRGRCRRPFCASWGSKWPQPRPPWTCEGGTGPRGGKSEAGWRRRWLSTKARRRAAGWRDGGRRARSTETGETRGGTPLPCSWLRPKKNDENQSADIKLMKGKWCGSQTYDLQTR